MPVAVGIEEHRIDVLGEAVRPEGALLAGSERPVTLLQVEPPGLPFGAADVDVVQPVAVDVADGQGGPFPRQQMWYERLAVVVVERVLLVLEIDGDPVRHVGENGG